MAKIHNWRIVSAGSPFMAPECRTQSIQGEVSGHPRFPDGRSVTTSTIASVDGRTVTTYSGTVYTLGRISRAQRALEGEGYDRSNPLG